MKNLPMGIVDRFNIEELKNPTDGDLLREAMRMYGIANSILDIARGLESMARKFAVPTLPEHHNASRSASQLGGRAALLYKERRRREILFKDEDLFGEPAWDILLDLFIADVQGRPAGVSSACMGAAVPSTTALRWLSVLEHKGLIARELDPYDRRRTYVRITPAAYSKMSEYLTGVGSDRIETG